MNYWSPLPREAYTVFSKDHGMLGFGALPELQDLATWNLFWLSSVHVDGILDFVGNPLMAPMSSSVVEPCMETVQFSTGEGPLGELIKSVSAAEFINVVEALPAPEILPIIRFSGIKDWLTIAKFKVQMAAPFASSEGNMVYVNFGGHRGKIMH